MNKQSWKELTKKSYDTYAQNYASFATRHRGKLKNWIEKFTLNFIHGDKILDVGCGAGRDAKYFSEKNFSVTGIDFSEELIKIAKKTSPKSTFLVMDFERLTFPKNTFNRAWASASLYHIPKKNLQNVLNKIYEILKKEAVFFMLIRLGHEEKITTEKRGKQKLTRFAAYYQHNEIVEMLQNAKFKEIELELDSIVTGNWIGIFSKK